MKLKRKLNKLKDDNKELSKYIDLLPEFNNLKKSYKITKFELDNTKELYDKKANEFNEYIDEMKEAHREAAKLRGRAQDSEHHLKIKEEDIERYKSNISDAEDTINKLGKELRQRDLDNKNELIKEIEELKEYKEKYRVI